MNDDGTVTTRGERRGGGGAAAVVVDCPRLRRLGGRRVCSAARAQRERSASTARAQRASVRAGQHPEASRARRRTRSRRRRSRSLRDAGTPTARVRRARAGTPRAASPRPRECEAEKAARQGEREEELVSESKRSWPIGDGAVTCRHGRAALPDAARPSRRPPRQVRRAVSDTRGSKVELAEAEEAKIVAHMRTPARPCGAARRGASVAQPDAARLDAARRARSPQMPKKPNAEEAAEGRRSNKKVVFRDGAAGGFEPAPLNRRCPPETTSPPREAGASRSGEWPHK